MRRQAALLWATIGMTVFASVAAAVAKPPTPDPTYGLPLPSLKPDRNPAAQPSWIWTARTAGHQVVYARAVLTLTRVPSSAQIAVTADDSFRLFVNGRQLDQSQGKELGWKTAHVIPLAGLLKPGRNAIGIEAVNDGGAAGILARLDIGGKPLLLSDPHWKVLEAPAAPVGWATAAFDDSTWTRATVEAPLGRGPWGEGVEDWPGHQTSAWYLAHRMMRPAAVNAVSRPETIHGTKTLTGPGAARVTVQPGAGATAPPALLVDFGEDLAGRLVLHGSIGSPVVVTTGESREECFHTEPALDNSGPTSLRLGGTEAVATPYSAFRYALLRFPGHAPVTLTSVTLDHKYYPVAYKGSFSCSDPLLTKIWYIGAYTAHNCMQEDIWDAPKRDRGLWCGDLQVTGQTINDVFADRFLMEQSIRKLREIAQAGRPDTALPTAEINNIPGYTAAWFCELADFDRHQGDMPFLRSQHQKIISLLEFQKTDFDSRHLFTDPRSDWDFCDWAPDFVQKTPQTRATTDLYIVKGVREAVFLLSELGDRANAAKYTAWADTLTLAARQNLADAKTGLYGDRLQENAMAVYAGVATAAQRDAVYDRVLKSGSPIWTAPRKIVNLDSELMSPYYGYFVLGAYDELGRKKDGLDLIRRYWGGMVKRGAVTWWEKFDPAFPTSFGPLLDMMPFLSLSHGWSTGPTSYLTESILGVRPTSSGFKTVNITPRLGDLQWARGDVPTPHGPIRLRVARRGVGTLLRLTLPAGVDARIGLPGTALQVNGRAVTPIRRTGFSYISLHHAGQYQITADLTRTGKPPAQ